MCMYFGACKVGFILTYLLTPWSRVLLEKLTGSQLVKKFPAFYGTRNVITAFTNARHLSLFWARPIQSMPPLPTSWRSILILFSHLRLVHPSGPFPSAILMKTPFTPLSPPYVLRDPPISFISIWSPEFYWEKRTDQSCVYKLISC
jgi:hypothetical protein